MGNFYTAKAALISPHAGDYPHRFGGQVLHKALGQAAKHLHLHCLYLFATDDPALPDLLPNCKWLPLYYPMFNDACDFAYQVLSDEEIVVHEVSNSESDDFPYEGFPRLLPEHAVSARSLTYDEQKTLVYSFVARDHLAERAISEVDKEFLKKTEYPFTQLGGIQYMTQGVPQQRCPNQKCECSKYSNMHKVFGVVWNNPVPGFQLWGDDYSQIIFQICPECSTICVCNRCG